MRCTRQRQSQPLQHKTATERIEVNVSEMHLCTGRHCQARTDLPAQESRQQQQEQKSHPHQRQYAPLPAAESRLAQLMQERLQGYSTHRFRNHSNLNFLPVAYRGVNLKVAARGDLGQASGGSHSQGSSLTLTLRLWVPSPLVAQAAGLCAAEPAAPLERDRVRGRTAASQPDRPSLRPSPALREKRVI